MFTTGVRPSFGSGLVQIFHLITAWPCGTPPTFLGTGELCRCWGPGQNSPLHPGNEWSKDAEQPQGTAETWGLGQDFQRPAGVQHEFFCSNFYFEMDSRAAKNGL